MLAAYAVRSASTPLTIRTAHRVPRGREQEHTPSRAERASTRKQERTRRKREQREQALTQASAHTRERREREESKHPAPTPAPLSRASARLLASPRVQGGKEGF